MSYPICQNGEWLKLTIMRLSHAYGRDISNAHTEKKKLFRQKLNMNFCLRDDFINSVLLVHYPTH